MTTDELNSLKSYLGTDAYNIAVIFQVFSSIKKYLSFKDPQNLKDAIDDLNAIIGQSTPTFVAPPSKPATAADSVATSQATTPSQSAAAADSAATSQATTQP